MWVERSYHDSTEGRGAALRRFRSVVVITSALHAEGPRFDPGRNHCNFLYPYYISHKVVVYVKSDTWAI